MICKYDEKFSIYSWLLTIWMRYYQYFKCCSDCELLLPLVETGFCIPLVCWQFLFVAANAILCNNFAFHL